MFAAFLCTILFSVSVICGHRSAKLIGGTEANFWRLTTAALLLGTWAFIFGPGLNSEAYPLFILSGFMGIGVGDVTFFQALPKLGSRLTLLLIECLSAPFGAVVEWLWMGTTLTLWQILCGIVILVGVGLALKPGDKVRLSRRDLVSGVAFCTAAALGTAFGAVLSRKAYAVVHSAGQSLDGGSAAFYRVLGGLFIGGLCLLAVKQKELRVQARAPRRMILEVSARKWRGVWPWVLMNALAGQTLGVSCMQLALEQIPTGLVLAIIAVTPIVVIPLAYVFEGERPTRASLLGGAIAVAGVMGLTIV